MPAVAHGQILRADLRRVIYALSDALDLVGVDDIAHGKRVGIMAAECARQLALPAQEIALLFDLGLLHDIGVSSTVTHGHLVAEFDWECAQGHCAVGYERLRHFAPLAHLALPIRYHHTRWPQLVALGIDATTARRANLVYLVDRVDALAAAHYADGSLLARAPVIRRQIAERGDAYFAPELVAAFLAASRAEAFWLTLEARGIQSYLADMLAQGEPYAVSVAQLKQLATIFSRIVDAKSPFTAEHSLGVATLARFIAQRLGIGARHCDRIEIAGLLHDVGKLRVADAILDKPGPLDEGERLVMNTHSFETYQILRQIPGFAQIALWAACHHEEPDGNGYPFHLPAAQLALEARILRVADIFQAMVQDRPYRAGLPAAAVLDFLRGLARERRVDGEIVAVIAANLGPALAAALPGAPARAAAEPAAGV